MRTKTTLVLGAVVAISTSSAALAQPCTQTSYDNYLVPGFSCTVDDKTLSSFSYANTPTGGATPVAAADIQVIPLNTPGNPGLRWAFSANAATGQTNDLLFDYVVNVNPGGRAIEDASETVTGGTILNGFIRLDETLGNDLPSLHAGENINDLDPSDSVSFPSVLALDVVKDLFLSGGTVEGSGATVSAIENRFSEVPEPTSMALLGSALVGFGLFRRRRARTAA